MDTPRASQPEVKVVAMMDRQESMRHFDLSESILYSGSTLHLHGMSFDYASFECMEPIAACPNCRGALSDPLCHDPLHKRIFTWQAHMGRCGGDGKCLQAHVVSKLPITCLALCKPGPCGVATPSSALLIEPHHLRSDDSRPGECMRWREAIVQRRL